MKNLLCILLLILSNTAMQAQAGKQIQPTESKAQVILLLKDFQKNPISKADVWFETVDGQKVAEGKTDKGGVFEALLPNGKTYWVGVEDSARYGQVSVEAKPYLITRRTVYFQGMVNGKVLLPAAPAFSMMPPPDGQAMVQMNFINHAQQPIEGEEVTLKALGSGKEFKGLSDANGEVVLKVPIGEDYKASLKYVKDLDKFSFPAHGGSYNVQARYGITASAVITQARQQRAINDSLYNAYRKATLEEQRKLRDGNLNKTVFAPVGTSVGGIKPALEQMAKGYSLKLSNGSTGFMHGPVAVDNLLIGTAPWADSHIYAFDLESGVLKWAVTLGEGGPCAAAVSGGLVVVITESCSIYILKQETGALVWSGFLSPFVLSAAALSDGKAYVVYEDADVLELEKGRSAGFHALACFDLKTGKPLWQRWVNGECMSSPVVDEGKVFLNTFTGYSYVVNATDGKLIAESRLFGSSAPVHKAGKIYMSQRNPSESTASERIAVFSAQNLSLIAATSWMPAPYLTPEGSNSKQGSQAQAAASLLNGLAEEEIRDGHSVDHARRFFGAGSVLAMQYYQGSRPFLSGDRLYVPMGNTLRCLKASNLEEVWNKPAVLEMESGRALRLPFVAGSKLVCAMANGKVVLMDPASGASLQSFDMGAEIAVPPIAWKGWLVGATVDGKVVAINTGDPSLEGWGQWGGGATRNSVR